MFELKKIEAEWRARMHKALSFDGVDDYVKLPAFQIGTDKISIIALAKYANDAPNWSPIIAQRVTGGRITTIMVTDNGKPRFEVYGEDVETSLYFHGNTYIRDNKWHFWALTYDGYTLEGWIDLVYQGSVEKAVGKIRVTRNWYVGWDYGFSNRYIKGLIAQILIYNRALSESEIKYLYHNPFDPIDPEHLVLWLNLAGIDVANSKWWDLSGKGNHGTIYGATEVKLVEDEVIVK